jgi:hypothetical protein
MTACHSADLVRISGIRRIQREDHSARGSTRRSDVSRVAWYLLPIEYPPIASKDCARVMGSVKVPWSLMRCISELRLIVGAYCKITGFEWCHYSSLRQRRLVLVVSEVCTTECDFSGVATKSTKIRARAVGRSASGTAVGVAKTEGVTTKLRKRPFLFYRNLSTRLYWSWMNLLSFSSFMS